MARIFLSHSSADNDLARALRDWMVGEGWEDLFLDFDPERGIAPGEKWERALYDAAGNCEAVLFLVTHNWLVSDWCLKEFHLANKLNKRLFLLLTAGMTIEKLPSSLKAEWQWAELSPGDDWVPFPVSDGGGSATREVRLSRLGLRRLREGLKRAGLDPRFFAWPPASDPQRAPYPGLRALTAEDAGIFFGREAQIISAIDRLRGLREATAPRFLTILGASGAGKSSFLRAGLLPRLERDETRFLVLPVMRPERAALSGESGLARALSIFAQRIGSSLTRECATLAARSGSTPIIDLFSAIAAEVAPASGRSPMLVVSVDQAEELFLPDGGQEARSFLDTLSALLVSGIPMIAIAAIRSDHYELLQSETQLATLRQETFSLPPLPRGAYENVIVGPALRMTQSGRKLTVEPALTQALLSDIEIGGAKDALPLLAFTLALLYERRLDAERLTLAEYTTLGGIRGSIEAAVENALAQANHDPRVPKDRTARLALLRRAFIPWLAGVDRESNSVRRRIARLSEVPPETRPLVDRLVEARLLAIDSSPTGESTIEPAHEALLRQWGALQGWLEENFAAMAALEGVQRATRDWLANARDGGWLSHSAGRLEDAEAADAQPTLAKFLSEDEKDYLKACRQAEDARRNRELEEARKLAESRALTVKRTRIGLVGALVLTAVAVVAAFYANHQREAARIQQRKAEASLKVVHSRVARNKGDRATAAAHALQAYKTLIDAETRSALFDAGLDIDPRLEFSLLPPQPSNNKSSSTAMAWLSPDDVLVALKVDRKIALARLTFKSGHPVWIDAGWNVPRLMFDSEDEAEIIAFAPQPNGDVYAARNNGAIELYRADFSILRWEPPPRMERYDYAIAEVGPAGGLAAFGGPSEAVFVHCVSPSPSARELSCVGESPISGEATAVSVDPRGSKAAVAFKNGALYVGGDGARPRKLVLAPDEGSLAALAAHHGRWAAILRPPSGQQAASLVLLEQRNDNLAIVARGTVNVGSATTLSWRRPEEEILHGCLSETLDPGPLCVTRVVDTGGAPVWSEPERLLEHREVATAVAVSPDGTRVLSRTPDGIRIWRWPSNKAFAASLAESPRGGWTKLSDRREGSLLLSGRDGHSLSLYSDRDPPHEKAATTPVECIDDVVEVVDGRVIACGSKLTFVRDDKSPTSIDASLPSPILPQGGLSWSGEGQSVVVSLQSGRVGIVDFGVAAPVVRDLANAPTGFEPFGLTVDRRRRRIIVSDRNGSINLFDLTALAFVGTLVNRHAPPITVLGAESLTISQDGRLLATTAAGSRVMLYDLDRNESVAYLTARPAEPSGERTDTKSVAFDRAGRRLAVVDQDGIVVVWSLEGASPMRWLEFRLPSKRVNRSSGLPMVEFARDGALVVLTPWSEVLRIGLDEARWIERLVRLGYDVPLTAPN